MKNAKLLEAALVAIIILNVISIILTIINLFWRGGDTVVPKAMQKYRQTKVKRVSLELYGTDEDIKAHLDAMKERGESVQKYLKDLIRADMR